MNEVRDIVARMMEEPAPPLRPAEDVLAVARQVHRRRRWATAAGSGALALVLVVGVSVAVRSLPAAPTTAPSVTGAAEAVTRAAAAHGAVMAQRIVAMLPDGLTAGYVETFGSATQPVVGPDEGHARILAAAVVRVFGAQGEGELYAYLVREEGSAAETVCAGHWGVDEGECWTAQVGDVTVQIVTRSDRDRRTKIEATRFLDGGRLTVGAWSGPSADGTGPTGRRYAIVWPPLGASPLDASALAALAADPAMLPA